jgi:hypothetical protein
MRTLGIVMIIIGIFLGIFALSMDTSVQVEYPMGNPFGFPERVNNNGLMSDKQNYLIFSGILLILGVIILLKSETNSDERTSKDRNHNLKLSESSNEKNIQGSIQEWMENNPNKTLNDYYREIKRH